MNPRSEICRDILAKVSEVMPLGIATEVIVRDNPDLPMGTVRVIVEQGQAWAERKVADPPPCHGMKPMAGDRARITNAEACSLLCCRDGDIVTLVQKHADSGQHVPWGEAWSIKEHPGWWAWSAFFIVVERGSVQLTETNEAALRNYDKPTDRDAQRRAILLAEMSRPVKGER